MVDTYSRRFHEHLNNILAHLPKKASKDEAAFIQQYFAKMPLMDFEKIDTAEGYAYAHNSFQWINKRTPNEPNIRIFQPTKAKHGWQSGHTIIEVLNDDRPFLVDSLTAELTRLGFTIYETIHPILHVKRTAKGALDKMMSPDAKTAKEESFIHFELSAIPSSLSEKELIAQLRMVLDASQLVVGDWKPMQAKVKDTLKRLGRTKSADAEEVNEVRDFLGWLCQNNFVFMGYVEYTFSGKGENTKAEIVDGSELGIFKSAHKDYRPQGLSSLPKAVRHIATSPDVLQITKANRKSVVHRPVLMDYVAIKSFDSKGNVVGECRFLGMFTSTVYYQSADSIPFIRRKIARTLKRANFDPASHSGKTLKAILEFFPRDELFQIGENDLFHFAIGVMSIEARPEVKIFVRKDTFERFISCMVYVPRERFSTYLREQIQEILEKAFNGKTSDFYTQMTDSPLARLHQIITTKPGKIPEFDAEEIEDQIRSITNVWSDSLREELIETHGEKAGEKLFRTYGEAFPDNFKNRYNETSAVDDITKLEEAHKDGTVALDLFRLKRDITKGHFHLKVYTPEMNLALSDALPMLENMGCRVINVNPYHINPKWRKDIAIRDFHMAMDGEASFELNNDKDRFEEALYHIWTKQVANDRFNRLILLAGLDWREANVIRAYSQYLRQVNFTYSQDFVIDTLTSNPIITQYLVHYFMARFDPELSNREKACENSLKNINELLQKVKSLAEDRIFSRFRDLIGATLRTNYFQTDAKGDRKEYLSFKLDSTTIPELPLPRPYREIFVYSQRTEGIHLRGGAVARGGLRWSDRPEDFRTEVLGLMKAQMVKNAVIVPQGSKGGFIVKNPPTDGGRDAFFEEGIACYKQFLSGLLDITDNIVKDTIVPPKDVVRHDDDDPYLVVAADKGTATFSDIANGVSADYGFWLGDAFASGGSVGYDHKAMGITARGAWVSVQRHFREMGIDTQKQDFTVAGIGDMSGDVFGNGMLLSKHIKLVAAFNHRNIFIDPDPDPAASFKERQRLFKKPRSTWQDYNEKLMSKGGGIYPRDAKAIKLSKEARDMLGTKETSLSPEALIKVILKAPIDLLWNGGIGTYVKATTESHEDVGDRATNAVRINGEELGCKVVGEGGNLGLTQLGRIEFARNGGRINTDAIDNSAGVDCSDHEVNIKIALGKAVESKRLSLKKRNTLLESMTDNVSDLVLIDNVLQTQALSIAEHQGYSGLEAQSRMMHDLESQGFLDRSVEYLPDEKQLADMRSRHIGLTRPELAVLLSYAKLKLFDDIKDSGLLDAAYYQQDLERYFPKAMQKEFAKDIASHQLRREIIATIITNSIINRAGITFVHAMQDETGMHPCDIARGYTITRDAFRLRDLWAEIEALSGSVDATVQAELYTHIAGLIERMTLWLLRNNEQPLDVDRIMGECGPGITYFIDNYESMISQTLKKAYTKQVSYYKQKKVPAALAKKIGGLEIMGSAGDVVRVSNRTDRDIDTVGKIYFELGARLRLGWLRRSALAIHSEHYWDRLAVKSFVADMYDQQRRLTMSVIESLCKDECDMTVASWEEQHAAELARYDAFIADIKSHDALEYSMLVVASRHVESLANT